MGVMSVSSKDKTAHVKEHVLELGNIGAENVGYGLYLFRGALANGVTSAWLGHLGRPFSQLDTFYGIGRTDFMQLWARVRRAGRTSKNTG